MERQIKKEKNRNEVIKLEKLKQLKIRAEGPTCFHHNRFDSELKKTIDCYCNYIEYFEDGIKRLCSPCAINDIDNREQNASIPCYCNNIKQFEDGLRGVCGTCSIKIFNETYKVHF